MKSLNRFLLKQQQRENRKTLLLRWPLEGVRNIFIIYRPTGRFSPFSRFPP